MNSKEDNSSCPDIEEINYVKKLIELAKNNVFIHSFNNLCMKTPEFCVNESDYKQYKENCEKIAHELNNFNQMKFITGNKI